MEFKLELLTIFELPLWILSLYVVTFLDKNKILINFLFVKFVFFKSFEFWCQVLVLIFDFFGVLKF
jgi:uncharacterized membrane protein